MIYFHSDTSSRLIGATTCFLTNSAPIEACNAILQKLVTFDFGDQTFHFSETGISCTFGELAQFGITQKVGSARGPLN